jgi:2-oxo-4-hydroxy-4-carboxy-5-ureidoimidazoline decarboxylase
MTSVSIGEFNQQALEPAQAFLLAICHSTRWAQAMAHARPFASVEAMQEKAQEIWREATEVDILEAFSGHARIGDLSALQEKYSAASKEQGQIAQASEQTISELFDLNNQYFDKNGFIFIVCAKGLPAEEMLARLKQRLPNTREQELANGAREQGKITALRIAERFTQ